MQIYVLYDEILGLTAFTSREFRLYKSLEIAIKPYPNIMLANLEKALIYCIFAVYLDLIYINDD